MAPKKRKRATPKPTLDITTAHIHAKTATRKKLNTARVPTWSEDITWYQHPHFLGGGGCGQAHLWLAVDEQERILQRLVVKDCFVECGSWRDVNQWHGNPKDVEGRVHVEIHLHRTIHPPDEEYREDIAYQDGRENIARMFHSEVWPQEMGYRLYLQYYPHGDLGDILTHYPKPALTPDPKKKAKATPKSKSKFKKQRAWPQGSNPQPEVPTIPEPFLWNVLESLTRACLVLEHGHVDPDWQSIVHRDFKLENV